jgi:hypothetical protein
MPKHGNEFMGFCWHGIYMLINDQIEKIQLISR